MPGGPHPIARLRAELRGAVEALGVAADGAALERPKRAEQGDYSTNAALAAAPGLRSAPREVAGRLEAGLRERLGGELERIEVAGPGFVNLFMSNAWHRRAVTHLLGAGGPGPAPAGGDPVLLEFVSANPTGPLTVAGGRGAAYGDSLARMLEACGRRVTREYYLNDAGAQVRLFAESIAARMRGGEPPQDGYAGEYVGELANELAAEGVEPDELDELARRGTEAMRRRIERTLERFGVRFDVWSSERELRERGTLESTLDALRDAGETYESEGALWLRTSAHGDDKDRVLVRSDGEPTYFAVDVAYHRDKVRRGAGLMIDPLGADHHGYVPRMKAAMAALGIDPDRYEAPIMQLVTVVEGGERVRMSKRRGEFVTLDELVDDIGADAGRWFLLQRSHDTALEVDLELARTASQENPVYYVQYAHARIASILQRAEEAAGTGPAEAPGAALPCKPAERALIRRLLEHGDEVADAAARRAPHRLCAHATAVAADFHAFYRDCKVVGADEAEGVPGLERARLEVCLATRLVIARTLALLGVSAPERM
jgi:arginyl-tRNA synthetase